jgi:hypothetical protein
VLFLPNLFYNQVIYCNFLTRSELTFTGLDKFNNCRLSFVTGRNCSFQTVVFVVCAPVTALFRLLEASLKLAFRYDIQHVLRILLSSWS